MARRDEDDVVGGGGSRAHTSDGKQRSNSDANDPYNVTADELRQFIERFEQLESEKKDIAEQQKELMAEIKGRGYDSVVFRAVIKRRKQKPDAVAEFEAVLELYLSALNMT